MAVSNRHVRGATRPEVLQDEQSPGKPGRTGNIGLSSAAWHCFQRTSIRFRHGSLLSVSSACGVVGPVSSVLGAGVQALRLPHLQRHTPRGRHRRQTPLSTITSRIRRTIRHPHLHRRRTTQMLRTTRESHRARTTPLRHPRLPRRTKPLTRHLAIRSRQRQTRRRRRHRRRHRPSTRRRRHRLRRIRTRPHPVLHTHQRLHITIHPRIHLHRRSRNLHRLPRSLSQRRTINRRNRRLTTRRNKHCRLVKESVGYFIVFILTHTIGLAA